MHLYSSKNLLMLIIISSVLLTGCSLFQKKQNDISNNDVDDVNMEEQVLPEVDMSTSLSKGKISEDVFEKVIEKNPDILLDTISNESDQKKTLLEIASENNITLEGDEIPDGLDKNLVLEIKMLSILRSGSLGKNVDMKMWEGTIHWSIHKNIVFFYQPYEKEYFIYPEIDGATFDSLGPVGTYVPGIYFKDKHSIYRSEDGVLKKIDGIDGESFKYHYLHGAAMQEIVYATDKNHVYIFDESNNFVILEDADSNSFEEVKYGLFKDNKNVWDYDISEEKFNRILGVDAQTFKEHDFMHGSYYADKNHAYYIDRDTRLFHKIKKLDLNNFEVVFGTILKNDDGLYYFSSYKTPTLVKVSDNHDSLSDNHDSLSDNYDNISGHTEEIFCMIDDILYFYNPYTLALQKLDFIDMDSFEILSLTYNTLLILDKNGIYELNEEYDIALIENISQFDMTSFELLSQEYGVFVAKDKNNVYVGKKSLDILAGADSSTFELVEFRKHMYYGKDKNNIYYVDKRRMNPHVLENVDPQTFEVYGPVLNWFYYATDKDNVWFYDNDADIIKKIDNANPADFNLESFESHAKNYFYK